MMRPKLNLFFLLLFSLTVSFSWAQVPSYVPTNGLIGWWPFNGNANDESGNGHDGILVNSPLLTSDKCGNPNSAYFFDCPNYIRVEHDSDFNLSSHSISLWMYNGGSFYCTSSISKVTAICKGSTFDYLNSLYLGEGITGGFSHLSITGAWWAPYSPSTFMLNNIVLTYDSASSTAQIFVNDSLLFSVDTLEFSISNDSALYFAYPNFSTNPTLKYYGYLDDIGIWNRALTRSEVSALYYSCNTSIGEQLATKQINFFPNPAIDKLTIDCGNNFSASNNYELRITNTLGQKVFSSIINQQQLSIDLSTWTCKGIYFAYLFDENGELQVVRKIIVE